MRIGDRIKFRREELDITQKELAKRININYSVMNRIESGERPVRDEEIKNIAEVLDVSTDYLLGVTDIKNDRELLKTLDEADINSQNISKLYKEGKIDLTPMEWDSTEQKHVPQKERKKTMIGEEPTTIAAHLPDGVELTDDEQEQLDEYIQFLLSRRKK